MRRIVTGSIICLLLSGLPFLSACRCLPCMSGVPYQNVLEKGDALAPGKVSVTGKAEPLAGRRNITVLAVHETYKGNKVEQQLD
jgi:hypothetical protein